MRFWSDPDTELKLAKDTGVQVFRMGIDWTRVMPEEPVNGPRATVSMDFRISRTLKHDHMDVCRMSFLPCSDIQASTNP